MIKHGYPNEEMISNSKTIKKKMGNEHCLLLVDYKLSIIELNT